MGYFDKAHITNGSSRFNLEPGSFTSTFFKETVRRRPDAWRMFGFVHADHKSSAENSRQEENANVTNYHRQLNALFTGLRNTQNGLDTRLKNVQVQIGDHPPFMCELVVRFICFVVDMPAANMLCGTFDNHGAKVIRHHHACNAGFDELDNPYHDQCIYNDADDMFSAMRERNKKQRRLLSVKKVENHAFATLQVGNPKFNICLVTPFESMHTVRLSAVK